MQIDENDELACCAIICRQTYKDRMGESVKDIVEKYWLEHAQFSPNSMDVIQNIGEVIKKIGKSRKKDINAARRAIQT